MRIAVFQDEPSGGARRALHAFCRYLRERHRLDVYTLGSADRTFLRDEDVADRVVVLPYEPRPPVRFGLWLNDLRRSRDVKDLCRVNALAATEIDAGSYDVVLVDACRFLFTPPIVPHLRTPTALYVHDGPIELAPPAWRPTTNAYRRARHLWHAPLERRLERRAWSLRRASTLAATRVLTNSEHTRRRVQEGYGVTGVVCAPPVDVAQRTLIPADDSVLSVGELEPRKGFDLVIEAVAALPEAGRPPLRIVGNAANPDVRRRLERQAAATGVDLDVRVGASEAELHAAYRGAAVFAYGSHEESLGLAPLEAMAHARPVVAVGEGGVTETVVDGVTGFLTSRSARDMATRLAQLLADRDLAQRIGDAGYEHVATRWDPATRGAALEAQLLAIADADRVETPS
jgi:glycosyltransferase involved in cell wall biosynthesis